MVFLKRPLTPEAQKYLEARFAEESARAAVASQEQLRQIPIKENHEIMVDLEAKFAKNAPPISFSDLPFHEACGDWAGKRRVFWVRKEVADKIWQVADALQSVGLMLHIEDAFRPVGVQEGLFLRRVRLILDQHPEWRNDFDKVLQAARSFTAISPELAGHKSAASLDVTVKTLAGKPLNMGNAYPEGGAKVAMDFPHVLQSQWQSRQLLQLVMGMVELAVYPFENWHCSSGDTIAGWDDQRKAPIPGYVAKYGPLKGFDERTGEVFPYDPKEYSQPFFSKEELLGLI